eukprot:TRINITY_DN935_c0_g1_i6.p1 TRINITY_DN935_c0_g1~~TRINITY_DN935_c0_g1_i6.p1  ORF type:complete len:1754 (-),score=348.09 TRINITY_DN935_c0_g1_i6:6294-11555(-)
MFLTPGGDNFYIDIVLQDNEAIHCESGYISLVDRGVFILSPSKDVAVPFHGQMRVRWETIGILPTETLDISLQNSFSFSVWSLATNVLNTGVTDISLPSEETFAGESSFYYIKITLRSDTTVMGESDSFSMRYKRQSLSLYSIPQQLLSVVPGSSLSLKWDSVDIDEEAIVSIVIENGFSSIQTITTTNTGEYVVDIPFSWDLDDGYKVRLSLLSNNDVTSTSPNFAVSRSPPMFEIIKPHGGLSLWKNDLTLEVVYNLRGFDVENTLITFNIMYDDVGIDSSRGYFSVTNHNCNADRLCTKTVTLPSTFDLGSEYYVRGSVTVPGTEGTLTSESNEFGIMDRDFWMVYPGVRTDNPTYRFSDNIPLRWKEWGFQEGDQVYFVLKEYGFWGDSECGSLGPYYGNNDYVLWSTSSMPSYECSQDEGDFYFVMYKKLSGATTFEEVWESQYFHLSSDLSCSVAFWSTVKNMMVDVSETESLAVSLLFSNCQTISTSLKLQIEEDSTYGSVLMEKSVLFTPSSQLTSGTVTFSLGSVAVNNDASYCVNLLDENDNVVEKTCGLKLVRRFSFSLDSPLQYALGLTGSSVNVQWKSSGLSQQTLTLRLMKSVWIFADGVISSVNVPTAMESYDFPLSSNLEEGTYYFQMKDTEDVMDWQTGAEFYIRHPTISLLSPHGGSTAIKSKPFVIRWESLGVSHPYVSLALLNEDSEFVGTISSSTENDGSYVWNPVPIEVKSGRYYLKVQSTADSSFSHVSDLFAIENAITSINVYEPSSNNAWRKGITNDGIIRWDSYGMDSEYTVRIVLERYNLDSSIDSSLSIIESFAVSSADGSGGAQVTIPDTDMFTLPTLYNKLPYRVLVQSTVDVDSFGRSARFAIVNNDGTGTSGGLGGCPLLGYFGKWCHIETSCLYATCEFELGFDWFALLALNFGIQRCHDPAAFEGGVTYRWNGEIKSLEYSTILQLDDLFPILPPLEYYGMSATLVAGNGYFDLGALMIDILLEIDLILFDFDFIIADDFQVGVKNPYFWEECRSFTLRAPFEGKIVNQYEVIDVAWDPDAIPRLSDKLQVILRDKETQEITFEDSVLRNTSYRLPIHDSTPGAYEVCILPESDKAYHCRSIYVAEAENGYSAIYRPIDVTAAVFSLYAYTEVDAIHDISIMYNDQCTDWQMIHIWDSGRYEGFVAYSGMLDVALVVHRGTEILSREDILADFDAFFISTNILSNDVDVHKGFLSYAKPAFLEVQIGLRKVPSVTHKIVVTGHSLGGAMAHLTYAFLLEEYSPSRLECATFGSPRVGDDDWMEAMSQYETNMRRYTRESNLVADIVTLLPPEISGYTHIGQQIVLDAPYVKPLVLHSSLGYVQSIQRHFSPESLVRRCVHQGHYDGESFVLKEILRMPLNGEINAFDESTVNLRVQQLSAGGSIQACILLKDEDEAQCQTSCTGDQTISISRVFEVASEYHMVIKNCHYSTPVTIGYHTNSSSNLRSPDSPRMVQALVEPDQLTLQWELPFDMGYPPVVERVMVSLSSENSTANFELEKAVSGNTFTIEYGQDFPPMPNELFIARVFLSNGIWSPASMDLSIQIPSELSMTAYRHMSFKKPTSFKAISDGEIEIIWNHYGFAEGDHISIELYYVLSNGSSAIESVSLQYPYAKSGSYIFNVPSGVSGTRFGLLVSFGEKELADIYPLTILSRDDSSSLCGNLGFLPDIYGRACSALSFLKDAILQDVDGDATISLRAGGVATSVFFPTYMGELAVPFLS